MKSYIALLRGIGPGNPNMSNDNLRRLFEGLGFKNVRTVISSGNVLFESDVENRKTLEESIEEALPRELGFTSTAIVRGKEDLEKLVASEPFGDKEHSRSSYLFVTFPKAAIKPEFTFPHTPTGKTYTLLGLYGQELCSVVDLAGSKTPDLMVWLEKQFGKDITSRTYKTVERILKKFDV